MPDPDAVRRGAEQARWAAVLTLPRRPGRPLGPGAAERRIGRLRPIEDRLGAAAAG